MSAKKTIYGRVKGADGKIAFSTVEMDSIDAARAVRAHSDEWSAKPWPSDADAAAAAKAKADADAAAKKG